MKKLLMLGLCLLVSGCKITGEGTKIGIIVKCASEGFFFKTYQCELVRGGINNGSGTLGQPFYFTVEDQSMIPEFDKALNDQKEIKLSYHQEFMTFGRTENETNNSFADDIEFVNREQDY